MARINGITAAGKIAFGASLYNTKRHMDNSETYVQSKLTRLYNQALADCFANSKLESIRKFTNGG